MSISSTVIIIFILFIAFSFIYLLGYKNGVEDTFKKISKFMDDTIKTATNIDSERD